MHSNSKPQYKDIWYSASGKEFKGNEPLFFNIKAPWINLLESQWLVVRNELDNLLQNKSDPLIQVWYQSLVNGKCSLFFLE